VAGYFECAAILNDGLTQIAPPLCHNSTLINLQRTKLLFLEHFIQRAPRRRLRYDRRLGRRVGLEFARRPRRQRRPGIPALFDLLSPPRAERLEFICVAQLARQKQDIGGGGILSSTGADKSMVSSRGEKVAIPHGRTGDFWRLTLIRKTSKLTHIPQQCRVTIPTAGVRQHTPRNSDH
jgi:hypothetical protein